MESGIEPCRFSISSERLRGDAYQSEDEALIRIYGWGFLFLLRATWSMPRIR